MCGICGVWFRDKKKTVNKKWLADINNTMFHRGPDGEGVYIDGSLGLAHRRLSIIDITGGAQPMQNREGSTAIVFNGEIYNYKELRKEQEKNGSKFETDSDTETIIHQYEKHGLDCVLNLQGMFSFGIWDKDRKMLMLARDRIGIKPLYYAVTSEAFIFSSEIKAILKSGLVDADVDVSNIDSYLSLGWVPSPKTLFRGIYKLEPGTLAVINDKHDIRIDKYWDINSTQEKEIVPDEHIPDNFTEQLTNVVGSHLVSDVPVGAFLSGGLDSSAIVATMAKLSDNRIKTFSVGYDEKYGPSELPYAKLVAERFNTEHNEYILEPLDFFDSIEKLLAFAEEPIEEPSGIALFQLSKMAKEQATVLLAGEGMDEILAGYPIYKKMPTIEKMHAFAKYIKPLVSGSLLDNLNIGEKLLKYIDWVLNPIESRYHSVNSRLTEHIKNRMYEPGSAINRGVVNEYYSDILKELKDRTLLQKMTIADTTTWLPDCLLLKADKMTMAASIELRVPFLDHKFVEYCGSLQDKWKIRNGVQKYLLRKNMEGVLPDVILNRKKQGFPIPISGWFKGKLYEPVSDILLSAKARSRGYFRKTYVEDVLKEHRSGAQDHGVRLFSLLVLEMWHEKYVDQTGIS